MPTTTRTVYLTDENGNPLIDEQRNLRTLSFSLMQGYSYRLVERASIVSATYAQVVGYSTATGQTISGVENASEFDVGDFGIVQYAISDRNNTIGYVTCKVTAVGADSLTVNGIGISVAGADGADGKDGAPGADGKDGAATVQIGTVTTGAPGSQASVTNVGADNAAILNFTIPRGATGAAGKDGTNGADGKDGVNGQDGAAATIQIGEVITGTPGTNASVENTGTENAAILKFTIPRGATGTPGADGKDGVTFTPSVDTNGDLSWSNDGGLPNPETVNVRGAQGEAATVQVGQVTTLPAGSQATVTNSGTNQAAVLNFGIPTGATGANGITPHIGVDGFWYIGETNTNVKARGQDGEDGVSPHIGENGNWFIGNQDTNVKAEGTDGQDGAAATIEVGEVTTGAAGTQASVTNSGTENAAVFDFTIPKGADGASGVTDVTAGTPTEQDGYTVTPVTFNFEQGNSKTVNIQAKNGEGAGVQQNAIINRTASVDTADENSPDFVESGGNLWVKKITGYETEVTTLGATLPSEISRTSAATAPNGKIYVFGGGARTMFDDIVELDPVTKSVTKLEATLPSKRNDTSAATAPNGKIYVFGGSTGVILNDIVEFDPVTQSVTTLEATLPSTRSGTSAATAPNGKIYVFGGSHGSDKLDDIIEFDPVAQTVTKLSVTLPGGRNSTSAATAPNGKIYVFGGIDNHYLDDIIEFDPVTQSVTTLEVTLPSTRSGTSAATAPNGKIYVFGGWQSTNIIFDDIIVFDPVAQAVTKFSVTLPTARSNTSAVTASNGKIYVFGGNSGHTSYLDDIIEFAPSVAQYAYSPAVVLSQEEYTQFKNILNGVFSVGINAPNAEISGTLEAGNTTVNGTLTATDDISAQNVTASGAVNADSVEISGALSAGNTTVNGALTATGKITAPSAAVNGELTADSAEVSGTLSAGNTTVNGTLTATSDISAQNVTANGAVTADSVEVSGTLSTGNTTVNGTLSASGAVTVDGAVIAPSFNATT